MKIKSALIFLLTACSFSNSFANTPRIEYLCKLSNVAEEARINVVIDIGHTLFKRYCPNEHSLMQEYLRQIVQKYPRMTSAELEDQKQGALVVFSEKCANRPELVAFSENLNRHLEALSSDLMDRAISFFDREDPELPLETKNSIAHLYFERELKKTFNLGKILEGAHFDEAFDSPEYFNYLTVSEDIGDLKESALHVQEAVPSEQKVESTSGQAHVQVQVPSGHCENCKRKLHLIPFHCGGCEKDFCAAHHLPETHQCTFDYKGQGRKKLKKEMPQVIGDRIQNRL
jgi:hypothetical protein